MAYAKLKQTNPRVAIYVRVSTLHQVDKDSLPMQKQDLLAYAKLMLGTEDCVIFEDAGYSGKNTDRPGNDVANPGRQLHSPPGMED